MKHKVPSTSHAAYNQLKQSDQREAHYKKILDTLLKIGEGTCDKVAEVLGMQAVQIGRRMTELERDHKKVYKTGQQAMTRTNRAANIYRIGNPDDHKIVKEKVMGGETIADISRKMQAYQKSLF